MNNDDWAIVVGVGRYPGISNLDGSENDARDFRDWLVDPAGGDLDPNHVQLILSPEPSSPPDLASAVPTHMEVERAFERLDDEADANLKKGIGRKVGRRLYLYFSGHGYAPSKDDAALLMANATPKRIGNHIAGKLWAEWLYESGYFEEIAMFMDCCRDSYTTVAMRPVHLNKVSNTNGIQGRKRFYAYGTQWDRKAWERLNPVDKKVHGVFTTALLSGLRGAAAEPSTGVITAGSLKVYLYQNMVNFFTEEEKANPDIGREPYIDDLTNPVQPMVFAKIPLPAVKKVSVTINIPSSGIGTRADVLGGDLTTLIESINIATQKWQVALEQGLYEVRLASGTSHVFKVDASLESQDVNFS